MPSWKSLTGVPSFTPDTMLLMTDATVLVHHTGGQDWYRLKPDGAGRYDTGSVTWSGPFAMANSRQFFASGVLADGRVYVVGGEYSTPNDSPLAEIFDPQTNKWSTLNKPAAFNYIQGDANSCILQDGRVLFGALNTNQTAIWDPVFDTWTEAGTAHGTRPPTKVGRSDEETWTLLPDGTVLTVVIASPPYAEKYVPSTDTWVPANPLPVQLPLLSLLDTTVTPPKTVGIGEIGPAVLLPDGRLFFVGATGHTALYTTPAGTWAAGADLPPDTSGNNFNSPNGNIQTAIDAPAVLLPGGKVLLVGGNTKREVNSGKVEFWSNPSNALVYDPSANALTALPTAEQPPSNSVDTWQARLLLLPTGQVLMTTEQDKTIVILTDPAIIGSPHPGWRPVITGFTPIMAVGHHYKISGRQLNGLSQANSYGDDAQMATNYPIAKFTRGGSVSFFRTFDFSTMAVATGSAIHSTLVEIPAAATPGSYTLRVIANGIESDPVSVEIVPADPAIAVNLQDDLLFGTICDEPQFLGLQVFNVGGLDLIIDSVARVSGSAAFSVLANPVTPLTIAPGDQVDFTVRFAPTVHGVLESAIIRIVSNDPVQPNFDVSTSGTWGTGSLEAVVADNGNVGPVCVGRFADTVLTLNNNGPCKLKIFSITSSSVEFEVPTVSSYPLVIGAGISIDVPIRFAPTSIGSKTAQITITSDDPASPKLVNLSGEVPSGHLRVYGSTYFGEVDCGIAQKMLSICNVGDCPLFVSSVEFSRERRNFKLINNPFPATLHPGSCLGVVIQYHANCEPECCELVIDSDDPDEPRKVLDVVAFTRCETKRQYDKTPCCCNDRKNERHEDCC